jgi:hypothetical protein
MATLKWLVVVILAGYGGLAALLYLAQRGLMYFPETVRTSPAAAGLPHAEEIVLETADGEKVIAWHVAPEPGRPVVVYYHGNGASLRWRVERFRALSAGGTGLVALSYRGYGGSTGSPSETGLLRDGAAAYEFAASRYGPERVVLWGESLGTGIAVAIAAENPVAGVVLESAFTSAVDIAASAYPIFPVRLLMKDQFRSDQRIGRVTAPVLMIHGVRDRIVPIRFAERLYEMITAPKRFLRLADAEHNDHDAHGVVAAVKRFLAERVAQ